MRAARGFLYESHTCFVISLLVLATIPPLFSEDFLIPAALQRSHNDRRSIQHNTCNHREWLIWPHICIFSDHSRSDRHCNETWHPARNNLFSTGADQAYHRAADNCSFPLGCSSLCCRPPAACVSSRDGCQCIRRFLYVIDNPNNFTIKTQKQNVFRHHFGIWYHWSAAWMIALNQETLLMSISLTVQQPICQSSGFGSALFTYWILQRLKKSFW